MDGIGESFCQDFAVQDFLGVQSWPGMGWQLIPVSRSELYCPECVCDVIGIPSMGHQWEDEKLVGGKGRWTEAGALFIPPFG